MKGAIILSLVCLCILQGVVSLAPSEGSKQAKTVNLIKSALQEATERYDERVKQAMINGAQSKGSTRERPKSTKRTSEIGRTSHIFKNALNILTIERDLDQNLAAELLRKELPDQCQLVNLRCEENSKYRSINGTCNNIENPYWGATEMPNSRILPPAYANDNDDPRGGVNNEGLPKVRDISLVMHSGNGSAMELQVTHMVAQFGQFLDHDITLTPVANYKCCGNPTPDDDCWSMAIDPTDPFYRNRTSCLDFTRSTPSCIVPSGGNVLEQRREQFNGITAYIDGSVVYGSDEALFQKLRSHQNGKLVENSQYPGFVPWASDEDPNGSNQSLIAGDVRVSEMPGLTVMHTLFLRENRIADELQKLKSDWSDEKVFQETRRIVAAELQQITFSEFLPAVLTENIMKQYDIKLPTQFTDNTSYDSSVDATIFNSFSTAAYRFGHTLVNGLIQLILENTIIDSYNVRDNYNKPDQVFQHRNGTTGFDLILNGLIHQNSQAADGEIHSDMRNNLFMSTTTMIGSDLAARNIQRGRDHGLPPYNEFRKLCNLPSLSDSWETGRAEEIDQSAWTKLRSLYSSPLDIDLYTGGLSESLVEGGLSGPTFACLQATQFQRMMKGDRYFFTHANQAGSFISDQLAALRSRTLGDIVCQNTDGSSFKETAKNVFYVPSTQMNPTSACSDPSRQLDLRLFARDDV